MKTGDGGWTVIQRRMDGSVNFYRNWRDYQYGFGNLNGEFWLGLNKINSLTEAQSCLRLDMKDYNDNVRYANYDSFSVAGPHTNYKLTIGGYTGDAGDSLGWYHNGMAFSTKDRDHDKSTANCAEQHKGGWWYNACQRSNFNGWYTHVIAKQVATGVVWYSFRGYYESLKFAEMKVKRCST